MVDKSVIDTMIAEAGGNEAGLRAVAAVINNRASASGLTSSQVVKQAGQFEGYSSPGPASVKAQADPDVRAKAARAWEDITSGRVSDPTNGGTSFRAASAAKGMAAPHGTKTIGGNTFALGNVQPALAAINQIAPPVPQPRPVMAYGENAPSIRAITVQPNGQPASLLDALAAKYSSVSPASSQDAASIYGGFGLPPALPRPRPTVPTALVSRPVNTIRIDPLTNQPLGSAPQAKPPTLQSALDAYAARLRSQAPSASMKTTTAQAGNVALPPGVVPASAQRDMNILTLMSGLPIANGAIPKPPVTPSPSILGGSNIASGSLAPFIPSATGSSTYKEASRLDPSSPLSFGEPVMTGQAALDQINRATAYKPPTQTYSLQQMQVSNPAYLKYIQGLKADPIMAGPDWNELQGMLATPKPAPVAPPRYITVTRRVPNPLPTVPTVAARPAPPPNAPVGVAAVANAPAPAPTLNQIVYGQSHDFGPGYRPF